MRGIGIATYVEACGNNGPETADLTLDPDGGVTLLIGSQSTGQGHATSYAQLIAERLDLPPERVRVIQGDTDRIKAAPAPADRAQSPSAASLSTAQPKNLPSRSKQIAADALEAATGDLEIVDGSVRIAGTDRVISFADLAAHPMASTDKLRAEEEFSVEPPTYPNGTHIAEVEIDPDTGATQHHALRRRR